MKIGYQGIVGSNTEKATIDIVEKAGFKDYELIPLVSSREVIQALETRRIDFGVLAIKNSKGGLVKESYKGLMKANLELVMGKVQKIHHHLYVYDETIKKEDLKIIASHPQALVQCQDYIKNQFYGVDLKEMEDTATSAQKLADGSLNRLTGVLCTKKAGELNRLHLLESYVEDESDNQTEFRMYRYPKSNLSNLSLEGYWKCYIKTDNHRELDGFHIPRIVEINQNNRRMYMKAWSCHQQKLLFETTVSALNHSGLIIDHVVYSYVLKRQERKKQVRTVQMSWDHLISNHHQPVLSGQYIDKPSKNKGEVIYFKISKDVYDLLRISEFLS
jgi:prephenate dehydratase